MVLVAKVSLSSTKVFEIIVVQNSCFTVMCG